MNTNANNMNAPVNTQGAIAAAMAEANKAFDWKGKQEPKEKKFDDGHVAQAAVVVRRTVLGDVILFRADKEDREKGTIEYFDGKKGSQMQVAPLEFYRQTKPAEQEEVRRMVATFAKQFGFKDATIHVRARLQKESVMRKADANIPGDEQASHKELADKLIAGISKAIYQALAVDPS